MVKIIFATILLGICFSKNVCCADLDPFGLNWEETKKKSIAAIFVFEDKGGENVLVSNGKEFKVTCKEIHGKKEDQKILFKNLFRNNPSEVSSKFFEKDFFFVLTLKKNVSDNTKFQIFPLSALNLRQWECVFSEEKTTQGDSMLERYFLREELRKYFKNLDKTDFNKFFKILNTAQKSTGFWEAENNYLARIVFSMAQQKFFPKEADCFEHLWSYILHFLDIFKERPSCQLPWLKIFPVLFKLKKSYAYGALLNNFSLNLRGIKALDPGQRKEYFEQIGLIAQEIRDLENFREFSNFLKQNPKVSGQDFTPLPVLYDPFGLEWRNFKARSECCHLLEIVFQVEPGGKEKKPVIKNIRHLFFNPVHLEYFQKQNFANFQRLVAEKHRDSLIDLGLENVYVVVGCGRSAPQNNFLILKDLPLDYWLLILEGHDLSKFRYPALLRYLAREKIRGLSLEKHDGLFEAWDSSNFGLSQASNAERGYLGEYFLSCLEGKTVLGASQTRFLFRLAQEALDVPDLTLRLRGLWINILDRLWLCNRKACESLPDFFPLCQKIMLWFNEPIILSGTHPDRWRFFEAQWKVGEILKAAGRIPIPVQIP